MSNAHADRAPVDGRGALRECVRVQCMRYRAGGFDNDRGIAVIGLGFTSMQIDHTAHGWSRQISDEYGDK